MLNSIVRLVLSLSLQHGATNAASPIVVHVVADDLGRDDLGFMNGNKTHTPNTE